MSEKMNTLTQFEYLHEEMGSSQNNFRLIERYDFQRVPFW